MEGRRDFWSGTVFGSLVGSRGYTKQLMSLTRINGNYKLVLDQMHLMEK